MRATRCSVSSKICATLSSLLTCSAFKYADLLRILPLFITSVFPPGRVQHWSAVFLVIPSFHPRGRVVRRCILGPLQVRLHPNQLPLLAQERIENEHEPRFGRTASAATCFVPQHILHPQRRFSEKKNSRKSPNLVHQHQSSRPPGNQENHQAFRRPRAHSSTTLFHNRFTLPQCSRMNFSQLSKNTKQSPVGQPDDSEVPKGYLKGMSGEWMGSQH